MRGTFDAYNRLTTKNDDTLYFVYNPDSNESALYLGSRIIASAEGDSIGESSIDALKDVLISEDLADKSFLIYDAEKHQWIDIQQDKLAFVGATATSAGVSGFVPAPEMKQTNLFLRSDGTWVEITSASGEKINQNIINIINESKQSHEDIIANVVNGITAAKGDLIIIEDAILGEIYSSTAYIFNDEKWTALSKYHNANKVIFAEDIGNIPAAGENLLTVLDNVVSTLSIDGDNATITVDNQQFGLKNYGIQYYKFVAETGDYVLQIVDEDHPWITGLEPRVTSEDGQLVLAWFEQNSTTIDGINAQISALSTSVNDLQNVISDKANAEDVYTKDETDIKISTAIATADHLKRKIVAQYIDIQTYIEQNEDADQYIFMVPIGVTDYDNKYEEYIVINNIIEPVGNWSVNLDDYATIEQLSSKVDKDENARLITLDEAEKLKNIAANAEVNIINTVDEAVFKVENRKLNLLNISVSKVTNLENLLNNKVDKVEGSRLITQAEAEKLETVEANYIASVDENQFSVKDRKLNLLDISISKVTNLEALLNNKANKEDLNNLDTKIDELDDRVSVVESAIIWGDMI